MSDLQTFGRSAFAEADAELLEEQFVRLGWMPLLYPPHLIETGNAVVPAEERLPQGHRMYWLLRAGTASILADIVVAPKEGAAVEDAALMGWLDQFEALDEDRH